MTNKSIMNKKAYLLMRQEIGTVIAKYYKSLLSKKAIKELNSINYEILFKYTITITKDNFKFKSPAVEFTKLPDIFTYKKGH